MKVVIDTNIVISAALRDRDPEAVVVWITAHPDWQWVVTDEIIAEYHAVVNRPKFNLTLAQTTYWQTLIAENTHPVPITVSLEFPRDRKDAKFLVCALNAEADFFITGDRDFNVAHKLINTAILSVTQFKQLWLD